MLIYRTICRIDYPIAYELFDRLGHYAQWVTRAASGPQFSELSSSINITSHSSLNIGKVDGNPFRVSVSPTTTDLVIDFVDGVKPDKLPQNALVTLVSKLMSDIGSHISSYERIGFRSFVLHQVPGVTFEALLDYYLRLTAPVYRAIIPVAKPNDIGLVYELKDAEERGIRLAFGPYQRHESVKYFGEATPDIAEGMIFDIDLSILKVDLPKFNLERFAERHRNIAVKLSQNIAALMREAIQS